VREEAVWAENLDWVYITAPNQAQLVQALQAWRNQNPKAAVLDIAYADGYAYAGRITRMVDTWTDNGRPANGDYTLEVDPDPTPQDWGVCSALITLQIID
jgi:hypothetical protein